MAFVVVLLIVADRVGAVVAAHVLAQKVESDERLPSRPGASVGGIPFLTQAFGGKYSDVTITAHHLKVGEVPVTTLVAHLHGVHVPFGKAIHGDVHEVPVDRTDGNVFISYADLNHYLARKHVVVSNAGGGEAKVTGSVVVDGHQFSASGTGHLTVTANIVHVPITGLSLAAGSHVAHLPADFTVPVPLAGLPFRIQLANVTATSTGLDATGTVGHLVLGSPL